MALRRKDPGPKLLSPFDVAAQQFVNVRNQRGDLTKRDMAVLDSLLRRRARALFHQADVIECDPRAPITIENPIERLRDELIDRGFRRDIIGKLILDDVGGALANAPRTPADFRAIARAFVENARRIVPWDEGLLATMQLPPRGGAVGRPRNGDLDWLLAQAAEHGVADVEVARKLAVLNCEPVGFGSENLDLVQRWVGVIKSMRARRRRSSKGRRRASHR